MGVFGWGRLRGDGSDTKILGGSELGGNDGTDRRRTLDLKRLTSRIAFASHVDDRPETKESSAIAVVRPTFEEVYQETFPFVWRTVRRLGVVDSTRDDVTQEVFVTVYR